VNGAGEKKREKERRAWLVANNRLCYPARGADEKKNKRKVRAVSRSKEIPHPEIFFISVSYFIFKKQKQKIKN
jgi:hypothetical protein